VGRGGALADCGPSPPAAAYREEPGLSTTRFTLTVMRIKTHQKKAVTYELQAF
jgi:hypothetical protein